jgi:transposase
MRLALPSAVRPYEAEREQLLALLRSGKTAQRMALRCRIVLLHAEGHSLRSVALQLRVGRNVVRTWCRRFERQGLAGLVDRPRAGRPRRIPQATD